MSRHIGRNENWVKLSPTRYDGFYGYVECNKRGLWDAVVVYQARSPFSTLPPKPLPKTFHWPHFISKYNWVTELNLNDQRAWRKKRMHCGEWKRAREAMMAVEAKVKELKAEKNPDMLI